MVSPAVELLRRTSDEVLHRGGAVLTEPELYRVLAAAGLPVPEHEVLSRPQASSLTGPVVVKVVSRDVLHKSDVGGVKFVDAAQVTPAFVEALLAEVSKAWAAKEGRVPALDGVLVMRRVAFDERRLGAEVIVGLRYSRDFGFVGMIGLGGVKTELFGSRLPRREAAALFDPLDVEGALRELKETLVFRDLAGQLRGSRKTLDEAAFRPLLVFLSEVAQTLAPVGVDGAPAIDELEFNPFLVDSGGRLVPVDGLARISRAVAAPVRPPVEKLKAFFEPRRVCVAGVSSKGVNMGRIILRNLLRDGFTPAQLSVLKPGDAEIDGVPCVASPEALEPVDLAVLAVSANAAPEVIEGLVRHQKAEAMIVIPGGMAEKEGGAENQRALEAALARSRLTPWRGPVMCGPNSMGVVSRPGHYDTTFIPAHKLPPKDGPVRNLAFISQSGAFTITRGSHLEQLAPRYLVSAGNQADLGVGDFVSYVVDDPEVQVIAAYVEGFQAGDGARFVAAAKRARAAGKQVILYKGGRSPEGQGTAAGHTAAIAGDYRAAWHLSRAAGVIVTESFAAFEGAVRVACSLAGRSRGRRVMVMSNAGFEAVGMADWLRGETWALDLSTLSKETRAAMQQVLATAKLDELVDVKNPLDVTPSASDAVHAQLARLVLADASVDALVMGVVPMSPSLASLGPEAAEAESIRAAHSLAQTLPVVFRETKKPIVAVVDAGRLYDPLVTGLERAGVPVFRRADEAVMALGAWLMG